MASAFVLINTEIGGEEDVIAQLKAIPEVEEVNVVYGVYDIVAKITADSMDVLKELITTKVRHLNKIRNTMSMIAAEMRTIE